jgi:hypothetical protein
MDEPTEGDVTMWEDPMWLHSEKRCRQHPRYHEFVNDDRDVRRSQNSLSFLQLVLHGTHSRRINIELKRCSLTE